MQYCLDSNIFIQAKNLHYPFDVVPGFWDLLDQQIDIVGSVMPICKELMDGNDKLAVWAKDRKNTDFFNDVVDDDTQNEYRNIAAYIHSNYSTVNAGHFLSKADPWLIAYAKALDCTVVTGEASAPDSKSPKIPDVCTVFSVPSINVFEMLRLLGIKFVLEI